MSVGTIGPPNPGFFTSPSTLPAGLAGGSAVGPSKPAGTTGSTSGATSYQTALSNLTILDNIELVKVAEGTPDQAAANVSNVLAQATALQQKQLADAHAAQLAAGHGTVSAPAVPSLLSIVQQSNAAAAADLANGTIGGLVNTSA